MFSYARGKNRYDNLPAQCAADSFKAFAKSILEDVSAEKGQTFVCAAVSSGLHKDQNKYPGEDHWRQQHLALPRRFLAFDFDGFESPEVWEELRDVFPWKAFFYTTSSHTPENPRARAFVELDREVDHDEGVELGMAAQAYLESVIKSGWIKFDVSVYRSTQPIYTPVEGFVPYFAKGKALNVGYILTRYRAQKAIEAFNRSSSFNGDRGAGGFNTADNLSGEIPEGQRNSTLLAMAGRYRAEGMLQPDIEKQLLLDNEIICKPPLELEEVLSVARRYEHQSRDDNDESHTKRDGGQTAAVFSIEDGDLFLPVTAPPPRDYIFANSVTRGTAIMVGGLGGTSKTTLVMLMAINSALGKNWGSLQIREGSSLLFLGEESAEEKSRRFGGLCADLSQADRAKVTRRVRAFPAIGKDLRVTRSVGGDPHPTGFADEIVRLSREHQGASGIELSFLVLDHTRLFMSGDPNAADDVSQLTRVLAYIANATQAVVILIAHSPKSVIGKDGVADASEIFGSGAFTDNTRGAFVLHTMRPEEAKAYGTSDNERSDYVCLTNVKANYGKAGGTWWFRKDSVPDWQIGTLVPATLYSAKLFPQYTGLSKRLVDLVKAKPGTLTVSKVRGLAGKAGDLGASDREVRNALDRLIEEGELILEPLSKAEQVMRGLSANVKEVLNLPTAGVKKVLGAG